MKKLDYSQTFLFLTVFTDFHTHLSLQKSPIGVCLAGYHNKAVPIHDVALNFTVCIGQILPDYVIQHFLHLNS